MKRLGLFLTILSLLFPAAMSFAQQETESARMLRRVKPAVVFIQSTISARAEIKTAHEPESVEVTFPSSKGSGFIINPHGYVVTNGHVVEEYHQSDIEQIKKAAFEALIRQRFLPRKIMEEERKREAECLYSKVDQGTQNNPSQKSLLKTAATCKKPLSKEEKERLFQQLSQELSPQVEVKPTKKLHVILSNKEKHVAEIKAYSPSIREVPGKSSSQQHPGKEREAGKDVAILKIEARHLPTVKIGDADTLQLGETVYAIGFPRSHLINTSVRG